MININVRFDYVCNFSFLLLFSGSDHITDTEALDPTEMKTSGKHSKHKILTTNGNAVKFENNATADTNVPPEEKSGKNVSCESLTNGETQKEKPQTHKKTKPPSSFLVGLGFGSLIFLTEWVFGEVSLICRWVVEGYPNHGPLPYPWG